MSLVYLYKLLNDAILNNDEETFRKTIDKVPLEKMTIDATTVFLRKILELCQHNMSTSFLPFLFGEWDKTLGSGRLSTLAQLFGRNEISDELLSFTVKGLPLFTSTELLIEYIEHDQNYNNLAMLNRIIDIYGELKLEDYQEIYNTAISPKDDGQNNAVLAIFFAEKIKEHSPFAEKPKWIFNFKYLDQDDQTILPYNDELELPDYRNIKKELPSYKKAAEVITKGLFDAGFGIEHINKTKKEIEKRLTEAPDQEYVAIMEPILTKEQKLLLENNLQVFRVLGPSNILMGDSLLGETIDAKYGGCRMLSCEHFSYADEHTTESVPWFTGSCNTCFKRIRKECWAIRRPRNAGGFDGCYCSKECIVRNEDIEMDSFGTKLLDFYYKKLLNTGIQDRLYRNTK